MSELLQLATDYPQQILKKQFNHKIPQFRGKLTSVNDIIHFNFMLNIKLNCSLLFIKLFIKLNSILT